MIRDKSRLWPAKHNRDLKYIQTLEAIVESSQIVRVTSKFQWNDKILQGLAYMYILRMVSISSGYLQVPTSISQHSREPTVDYQCPLQ